MLWRLLKPDHANVPGIECIARIARANRERNRERNRDSTNDFFMLPLPLQPPPALPNRLGLPDVARTTM